MLASRKAQSKHQHNQKQQIVQKQLFASQSSITTSPISQAQHRQKNITNKMPFKNGMSHKLLSALVSPPEYLQSSK